MPHRDRWWPPSRASRPWRWLGRRRRASAAAAAAGACGWRRTWGPGSTLARLDDALATGASLVATACPFCLNMFDDARKAKGVDEKLAVKDIAELVAQSI